MPKTGPVSDPTLLAMNISDHPTYLPRSVMWWKALHQLWTHSLPNKLSKAGVNLSHSSAELLMKHAANHSMRYVHMSPQT
eukprot:c6284_g1_i1 orf=32-271(-)